ncbi:MAG: cobalt transporter [Dictyoglomi bacterium]|jgi:cobalt/nickel transport protein|nr:cobalt transporter [Dictyoglomota bacterium]
MKKAYIVFGAFILVFILLIPFASTSPDGLENAMEHFSVAEHAIYNAPLSYGDSFITGVIAAIIGMALVSGILYIYIKLTKKVA